MQELVKAGGSSLPRTCVALLSNDRGLCLKASVCQVAALSCGDVPRSSASLQQYLTRLAGTEAPGELI